LQWAITDAPDLVAQALLLAHTERLALLDSLGEPLLTTLNHYLLNQPRPFNITLAWPILGEQLATLYLLKQNHETALTWFEQAISAWQTLDNPIACSRLILRQAGVYLLQEDLAQAAELARQAQLCLTQSLPLKLESLPAVRQLFRWFNMIYLALVRWAELPQEDVANLAKLAQQTGDDILTARGLHIYRVWCTVPLVARSPEIRQLGRELSAQVVALWQVCQQPNRADIEAMWTEYALTGKISTQAALQYAKRISQATPTVNPNQLALIENSGIRWWLQTEENIRVNHLAKLLPAYLKATHPQTTPVEEESEVWQMVRDIIGIQGNLAKSNRRVVLTYDQPPTDHFLNTPEWRVFSGQQMLPLVDQGCRALVEILLRGVNNKD